MPSISGSANDHQYSPEFLELVAANNNAKLESDGDFIAIGYRLSALISVYRRLAKQVSRPEDKRVPLQLEISRKIEELTGRLRPLQPKTRSGILLKAHISKLTAHRL